MKTPEQIRRETVPVKRNGLIYGMLGAFAGFLFWGGGWVLLHPTQTRLYPMYVSSALKSMNLSPKLGPRRTPVKKAVPISEWKLRYELLRHGNENHQFDNDMVHYGLYPPRARENPRAWLYAYGAVKPVYNTGVGGVFRWPLALTLMTGLVCLVAGLASDYRYHVAVIEGIHMDGSIVANVDEYNREVKGDGIKYAVQDWSDR